MTQLFSVILSLSVSGALVGLLVLLFRPLFGKIFSKRWMYYLWLLVIARLLVPVRVDVNLMEYLAGNLAAVGSALADAGGAETSNAVLRGDADRAVNKAGDIEASSGAGTGNTAYVGYSGSVPRETGDVADDDAVKVKGTAGQDNTNDVENTDAIGNGAAVVLSGETNTVVVGNREAAGQNNSGVEKISANGTNSSTGFGIWNRCLQAAAIIWILGVLFTALRKLWIYRRFVKEVCVGSAETAQQRQLGNGAACVPVTDERILWQYAEIQRKLRIGKRVPLFESTAIDIPMLIGLWQPRIYLPQALLAQMTGRADDICLILHHELVHYKRKDIWYKWLFQAALCVHWFNPFLYVFSRMFNVDCELACDETVLKLLSEEGRKAYGNMLLDVAQKDWSRGMFSRKGLKKHGSVPAMTLLEEKSTLKERLRGIARYHKTGLTVGLCSAVVLVMLLAVAVVCGAAEVRGGSGESLLLHNRGNLMSSLAEHFWEKSTWSEMWEDSFDLDQPILVSTDGKAYQMYDDDALIAGDSESDCWRAWTYSGGDRSVEAKKFAFNGSEALWILYANKETTLEISSVFHLYDGRFKLVWVGPDQTVQTLNESGEESTVKLTLPQGRNVIKMVGQKAKLTDFDAVYGRIKKEDFDCIYNNEAEKYAYQVLEGKQPFDLARLEEVGPYLKEKEVSELSRIAWGNGVDLSKEDWQELFVYSDDKLTAQYLLEDLQAGKVEEFESGILVRIAPYMQEEDVSDCFQYLLERDAVSDSDWQKIFVYSDGNKSAGYLAEALRKGTVSSFSDRALQEICPYVSVKELTDVVTAMDELSFESLERVLAYVQDMDEAATCVCHYIDLGNVLTKEQLRKIEAYLNEEDFYQVVEYNGKKK